jgi:circadian clock protein KaiC
MDSGGGRDPHVLSLTHGVLEMEQLSPDYGASRRRLRILKMRGVKFHEGYHDYAIATGGLRIFPRLVAADHRSAFRHEPVSSGIKEMDELFGGGLDRGTTTLIIGQAGTGKSTIALQYAAQMARQGEKSMIFAFDETRDVMLTRATNLGLDIAKHDATGMVTVQQVDPAELSPGEFAVRILQGVANGTKLVVIDSLSGYLNAMPGEKYLNSQMHELCSALNQKGVITILIVPQHGLINAVEAPVDISYLADTVVSVRFFEAMGEIKQALAVIKKRTGHHERTIREFKMERSRGLRVGGVLKDFHGVLTGVPTFKGTGDQILKTFNAEK